MLKFIWQIIWPMVFYGLMIDLASIFLYSYGELACTFVGAVLAVPVLFWQYRKRRHWGTVRPVPDCFREFTGKDAIFCILTGIIVCAAVNTLVIITPVSELFPGFSETAEILYKPPVLLQAATMGLAVPAAEELIFRGLEFAKLREKCPFWQAALLSSVLFGVYHGNILQGIYGFMMGMIFSWIMEEKKTIAAPFFMHMAANMTSVIVMAFQR